jgi:CO/xanthine dehydrogenase Mo-binding subunit
MEDDNLEPVSIVAADGYACANVSARDIQRRLNIPCPGSMRAPGHAQGSFALESAIDEVAYELGVDPLQLRLRNYAETHPQLDPPGPARRCASATRSAPSGSDGPRATRERRR